MSMEEQVVDVVVAELQRQAEDAPEALKLGGARAGRLPVSGEIDLEALAQAVVGKLAGGP